MSYEPNHSEFPRTAQAHSGTFKTDTETDTECHALSPQQLGHIVTENVWGLATCSNTIANSGSFDQGITNPPQSQLGPLEESMKTEISLLFQKFVARQCQEVIVDLQTKVHALILDCRDTLVQPRADNYYIGPRYIPFRTNILPLLNRSDFHLTFSPGDIQEFVKKREILGIDDTTQIKILETEIAGARQRILLPSYQKGTLYRGNLIRLQSSRNHREHYNHVLVVTNTQWMGPDGIALVRVVGYHLSGLPVDPSDEIFGTRILGIPTLYCDVPFPPALNEFALKAIEKWPKKYFGCIRQSAEANP